MEDNKREIPQSKIKVVQDLKNKFKESKTILLASTKKLPSSQFHEIKKKLRGKAEIIVAKKSLVLRAIGESGKKDLEGLKERIDSDIALFFSDIDAFELSIMLSDNQSPSKAKPGDIAGEDISIEPGPTDLVPGPAISELSGVGLKVAVENGKLAIKQGAVVAKAGTAIKENVASVLGKLNIFPMKVGFEPILAYDSKDKKIYVGIRINKAETLEELRDSIKRALGLAVNVQYLSNETVGFFIAKAGNEFKALEAKVNGN
jgi:large subunit ribosomal protein L10